MTLGDAFARGRPNALNVIRLALAVGVIFWHSFPITGTPFEGGRPLVQLLGYGFVDGFFVISGFLITRSWLGNPSVRTFLSARASRILPAFWVCLLVTAFVLAPLGTWLSGGDVSATLFSADSLMYVVHNFGLWIFQYGIDGTPTGVPFDGVWNGSLWTLSWEFICYLGILVLGKTGLLRSAWPLCIAFALVWVMNLAGVGDAFDNGFVGNALRFSLVFLAGAVLAKFEDRVRLSGVGAAVAFVAVAVSLLLPDYRLLAAPALAYGLVGVGGLLSTPRLAITNDISYGMYVYAFPVQQLLASAGLIGLGVPGFWVAATLATVPLAAASWFLVERPVIRLNRRLQVARRPAPDVVATP
jgi:peptidoglycan/LPS O-acetylase OafA/YrhL